jgi:hypothetical protein
LPHLEFASVLLLFAGATIPVEPLTEARWLSSGADRVLALTTSPGECLAAPGEAEMSLQVEIGRAAFNSPRLLGGQAGRAGLSCASCHVDGRSNPDFFLEGLSGAPGTADVTSSIFSQVREDDAFNPVKIPSLVGVAKKQAFGTTAPKESLHDFIGAAIADEFDAASPTDAVMSGLIAYLSALDESACPAGRTPLSPRRALNDVRQVLAAADRTLEKGDDATADFLLVSAQAALGRIAARYPEKESDALRGDLLALSKLLGDARRGPAAAAKRQQIAAALNLLGGLGPRLHKSEATSLYDPRALEAYLKREDGN